jgi:mono/diheme cytochrome c family protein
LRRSTRETQLRRSVGVAAAALLVAAAASGCGATTTSREGADTTRGKELFQQKCGACHVLADAGTAGDIGPNLDDGFGYSRRQQIDESTFFEVTLRQMEIPGPPMPAFDDPADEQNYLPEQDRVNVAAYVAEVAGQPSAQAAGAGGDDPKSIFTASCGSCHVLSDAGTTGTVGPSLDESQVDVRQAARQIAEGGGGMPAFKDQLSEEQIRALAEYVVEARGGG